MGEKRWDAGRRLAVSHRDWTNIHPGGVVDIQMPAETGRRLALALGRLRQTFTGTARPEIEELYQALNYVLVADPASVAAHKRMEAGKGMEPAAGDPTSYADDPIRERPATDAEVREWMG